MKYLWMHELILLILFNVYENKAYILYILFKSMIPELHTGMSLMNVVAKITEWWSGLGGSVALVILD